MNTQEKKIINDILFHLPGWKINDHVPETRRVDAFLSPEEAHYENNTRKEVSSREVLTSYEKAKVHALNYIRRSEFPNHPSIYQAICYWGAGLLTEKYGFKDENIQESTLLIEEARNLLHPYVRKGEDFFTVSGEEFFWEEYMKSESVPRPRRNRVPPPPKPDKNDRWGGEEKEHLIHGHFHNHYHKRLNKRFPPNPCKPFPKKDEGISWFKHRYHDRYEISINPVISEDEETLLITATVKEYGKPCKTGKISFYLYEENTRKLLGTTLVSNGTAMYTETLTEPLTYGKRKLHATYMANDGYIQCEEWEDVYVKQKSNIAFVDTEIPVAITTNPFQPETVEITVNVTGKEGEAVDDGYVQFYIKTDEEQEFVKTGNKIHLNNGTANYVYIIPGEYSSRYIVKAEYMGNTLYGKSQTNELLTLITKNKVSILLPHLTSTKGATETLTIYINGQDNEPITEGELKVYLDNKIIENITNITENPIIFSYTLPDDIMGGDHILKAEYSGSETYSSQMITSTLTINEGVLINYPQVYASQTVEDNGSIIVGKAVIPVNVVDMEGNAVPFGLLEFECEGVIETLNIEETVTPQFSYNIPLNYHGGESIPYTITYLENENYPRARVHGLILIKHNVDVDVDELSGNQGDTVTLGANVTDENGENVPQGEIEFELDQNEPLP